MGSSYWSVVRSGVSHLASLATTYEIRYLIIVAPRDFRRDTVDKVLPGVSHLASLAATYGTIARCHVGTPRTP
jgi:hypothetical protein